VIKQRSLQKLQEVLHEYEREIDVRARNLEHLKQHVAHLRNLIEFTQATASEGAERAPEAPRERSRAQPTKAARNALVDILREAGHPMHSRDLLQELYLRGVEVTGRDPATSVRSYLSHDTRFVSRGQGLWDLASRVNGARPDLAGPSVAAQPPRGPRGVELFEHEVADEPPDPEPDPPADDWPTEEWIAAHEPQDELATAPF
jgi:hypothetical protein